MGPLGRRMVLTTSKQDKLAICRIGPALLTVKHKNRATKPDTHSVILACSMGAALLLPLLLPLLRASLLGSELLLAATHTKVQGFARPCGLTAACTSPLYYRRVTHGLLRHTYRNARRAHHLVTTHNNI